MPETATLPVLGVLPDRRLRGVYNVSDLPSAQHLEVRPFEDAFTTPWATDAHFVQYVAMEHGRLVPSWPRLNKTILQGLRDSGADVEVTLFAVDYDLPGHREWGGTYTLDWFQALLAQVSEQWAPAGQWSVAYTTRHGARLVYVLDESLAADLAEPRHRWLVSKLRECGLEVDPKCSDWTRIFRLPCVQRDGERTHESDYFWIDCDLDRRLPVHELGAADKAGSKVYAKLPEIDTEKPTPEECKELLERTNPATGRTCATAFYNAAKKRLQGRECYPCIFEHQPIAAPGNRDSTIHSYAGQAVAMLFNIETASPAGVYALLHGAVEQLEPDTDTPDWTDVLWSAVVRNWQKEAARAEAERQEQERHEAEQKDLIHRILDGMRTWCNDPNLHGDDEEAIAWLQRRLVLSVAANYLVMTPSGYYDTLQVTGPQVIPRIRELGMDSIIETQKLTENGVRDVQLSQVLNTYAKPVADIEGKPEMPGTTVQRIGKPDAVAIVPLYRRNPDLTPVYDAEVDEWLRELFADHYKQAEAWIGHALAWEEGPICALSIEGDPGVGKKMLVHGLAECLARPRIADAQDLVSQYQYGLSESPFLVVNEGWPVGRGHSRRPIDSFREVVAGDPMRIARKYMATMSARNPARVIFTANNLNVIHGLIYGQELGPGDRRALGQRILHFSVGSRASQWLRAQGGMALTGRRGRRWIAGDGGEPSDFIVARHFLWLYQNRPARDPRLLVEGNAETELMLEMRSQSGSAPLVIEIVLKLIEQRNTKRRGIAVDPEGRLFMLVSAVMDYYRDHMAGAVSQRLTMAQISEVFRSLVVEQNREPRRLDIAPDEGRKRWHELDVEMLLAVAQRDGLASKRLEELVHKQAQVKGKL